MTERGALPLVMLGDSHCTNFGKAMKEMGAPILGGPLGAASAFTAETLPVDQGPLRLAGELGERFRVFARVAGITSLADCRGRLVVSLGLAAARFYGSFDWRRVATGAPADPRKQHVSNAVLEAIIDAMQAPVVAFVDRLAAEGLLVCSIAGPPPQARHPAVAALGAAGVLALEARYRQPMLDLLARHGIPVAVAPEVTTEQGLLRQEFWGDDHAHGNIAYGRQVIATVLRITVPQHAQT